MDGNKTLGLRFLKLTEPDNGKSDGMSLLFIDTGGRRVGKFPQHGLRLIKENLCVSNGDFGCGDAFIETRAYKELADQKRAHERHHRFQSRERRDVPDPRKLVVKSGRVGGEGVWGNHLFRRRCNILLRGKEG